MPQNKLKETILRAQENCAELGFIHNELRNNVIELKKLGITQQEIFDNDLEGIFAEYKDS